MILRFLVGLLLCAFFFTIAYLGFGRDHGAQFSRPIEAAPSPPRPVIAHETARAPAAPPLPGGAGATVGAVVKCVEGGKVTYSNLGCESDRHPRAIDVQFTAGITGPSPEVVRATLKRMRTDAADGAGASVATGALVRSAALRDPGAAMQCRYLVDRNAEIDRWAREPQPVYEQERLKAEKLENIRQLSRWSC